MMKHSSIIECAILFVLAAIRQQITGGSAYD
jgi:hypothetical protein